MTVSYTHLLQQIWPPQKSFPVKSQDLDVRGGVAEEDGGEVAAGLANVRGDVDFKGCLLYTSANLALPHKIGDGAEGIEVLRLQQPQRVGLGDAFASDHLVVKVAKFAVLNKEIHWTNYTAFAEQGKRRTCLLYTSSFTRRVLELLDDQELTDPDYGILT